MLSHSHSAEECRRAYAAWNGFESPLRHHQTLASCGRGGHRIFWTVDARDEREALAQLPPYVAERTEVSEVREVSIP
jgi:hypothetical protein